MSSDPADVIRSYLKFDYEDAGHMALDALVAERDRLLAALTEAGEALDRWFHSSDGDEQWIGDAIAIIAAVRTCPDNSPARDDPTPS